MVNADGPEASAVIAGEQHAFAGGAPQKDVEEAILETSTIINDHIIGYCSYGHGDTRMLFICGGVGCYKKDFPEHVLRAFDATKYTIVCIDPPGYGTSRPPDRKQEVNRCMKDAGFCIKLMQNLNMTPFTVLGWSEGARTAVHVAGQGKQLVKNLILLAAGTRVDMRGAGIFRGMRNTDQWMPDAMEVYLKHYPREYVTKQWADLCDVVQQVYDLLGGRFPSDYVLPNLRLPVLVMTGGMDRFCSDPKYFTSMIPNCRAVCHSLGLHDFHVKYTKWFTGEVCKFVAEQKQKTDSK